MHRLFRWSVQEAFALNYVEHVLLEREDKLYVYMRGGKAFLTYDADTIKSFYAAWDVL